MLYLANIYNNFLHECLLVKINYIHKTKNIYLGDVISRDKLKIENEDSIYFCLFKDKVYLTWNDKGLNHKMRYVSSWSIQNFYHLSGKKLLLFRKCLHMDFKYILLSFIGNTNNKTRKLLFDHILL